MSSRILPGSCIWNGPQAAVPEPASAARLLSGMVGIAGMTARRRRSVKAG